MSSFRERLKQLRTERNMTQGGLADKLGITKSAISMYEQGKRSPDFETLCSLSEVLHSDLNYLVGKSDINSYYELTLEEMDELAMLDPYNRTPAKKQDLSAVFAEILQNLDADEYELDNKPVSDAARVAIKTGVNTALAMARAQK